VFFQSYRAAIRFYLNQSPVRQRAINLIERTSATLPQSDDFAGYFGGLDSPRDLYSKVTHSLKRTLADFDMAHRKAFALYHFSRWHVDEIAEVLETSPKKVYRMLNRVRDEFERDLVAHQLLVPELYN
jgi:DNA-directed RNA polymerase specialized sigma24 family protein